MTDRIVPLESRALAVMRTTRGWKKNRLARALGMEPGTLYDYESGVETPSRRLLERAAAVMDYDAVFVDRTLAYLRNADASRRPGGAAGSEAQAEREIDRIATVCSLEVEAAMREGLRRARRLARAVEERQAARVLWTRLYPCSAAERRAMVSEEKRFQTWAVAELLCDESLKAAPDNADRAVELAELALLAARLAPGTDAERARIQGYAHAHLGNAHRVHGQLPASDAAFRDFAALWKAGGGKDPDGLLNEARVLGLEASLRREQRNFPAALDLLERALAVDRGDEARFLLLNRARILEVTGAYEQAAADLRRALPLIDGEHEPRLFWSVQFNLIERLCDAGCAAEAEPLFDKVRKEALRQGNELDVARLGWLQAKIHAGLGRLAEAEAVFEQVRMDLLARHIDYDAAIVSLELAVLLLEQGRTKDVATIARELAPVFANQRVTEEVLATLKLFREAVEKETLTVEVARHYRDNLRRAATLSRGTQ